MATLHALMLDGSVKAGVVSEAIAEYGLPTELGDPRNA